MIGTVQCGSTILDAISLLNESKVGLVVVVDGERCVRGTLSDGDVRRGLLKGVAVSEAVDRIMNDSPFLASSEGSVEAVIRKANKLRLTAVPLVDAESRLLRILDVRSQGVAAWFEEDLRSTCAVIMAGGKGMRLRPLTEKIPKPMVEIDGRPILHHLVERLSGAGIKDIYISVNYLSHVIEEYFKDGVQLGVNITYLRENEELGTAGAITNLPVEKYRSVLSINGDILSDLDFLRLLEFHKMSSADFTVCTTAHNVEIPYGVLEHSAGRVITVKEKPTYTYLCNAGIYVFESQLIRLLEKNSPSNMTDLIDKALLANHLVGTFPMHEYWSDVGTHGDLKEARKLFGE